MTATTYQDLVASGGLNNALGERLAVLANLPNLTASITPSTPVRLPVLRRAGFPPLVDRLVFGLEPVSPRRGAAGADATAAAVSPCGVLAKADAVPEPEPIGASGQRDPSITDTIEQWLDARGLHGSERARRDSSARLFTTAVGLPMGDPVGALASLDDNAPAAYARLSDTVGGGWGTVAATLAGKTAAEIIAIATAKPAPKWAQRSLASKGRRGRFDHVIDLLDFVRDSGVTIPHMNWAAAMDGHAA